MSAFPVATNKFAMCDLEQEWGSGLVPAEVWRFSIAVLLVKLHVTLV
jgi:hypothetical protein